MTMNVTRSNGTGLRSAKDAGAAPASATPAAIDLDVQPANGSNAADATSPTVGSVPTASSSPSERSVPGDRNTTSGGTGRTSKISLTNNVLVVNNFAAPKPPARDDDRRHEHHGHHEHHKPNNPVANLGRAIGQIGNALTFGFLGGLFGGLRGERG